MSCSWALSLQGLDAGLNKVTRLLHAAGVVRKASNAKLPAALEAPPITQTIRGTGSACTSAQAVALHQ